MNVAITEIGSVRPVMIVLRQECRNRNTMSTVRTAPSRIVLFTRLTLFSTDSAELNVTDSDTSVGKRCFSVIDGLDDAAADLDHVRVLHLQHVDRDGPAGR